MSKLTDTRQRKGIKSPEFVGDIPTVSDALEGPFVYRHHVAWGDCDPAQIAYTAHIPRWGLLAIEHWYRLLIGFDWYTLNMDLGIGTPFVSLKFDFVAPVRPPEQLEITVEVERTGNSSLTHRVKGYQLETLCFEGTTVAAFVNAITMEPINIPPNIRKSIDQFESNQNDEHPI